MKSVLRPQFFPDELKSDRIILKKNSMEWVSEMYQNVNNERGRLREFLPWVDQTKCIEDEVKYIELTHRWWQEQKTYDYSFFRQTDGVYLGNGGVHTIDWNNEQVELGYFIWQPFEGQGYVSELVKVLEEASFKIGFYRVEIRCDPKNIRSIAVAQRMGYRQEGRLRQNQLNGSQRRDTLIFSKLRGE
jgi:RimJ/RimL family protein N-acetyltransferase